MLKNRDQICAIVRRRFDATLMEQAVAEAFGLPGMRSTNSASAHGERESKAATSSAWPLSVALGRPSADELANNMQEVAAYVAQIRRWQREQGFELAWSIRRVGGSQDIPTHLIVNTIDEAARLLGYKALRQLEEARTRAKQIHAGFPALNEEDAVYTLHACRTWDGVDFDLLLEAGAWFCTHDATGMTPRQVPLAGFHAKWLNVRKRRELVGLLAQKPDLGLVDSPPAVAFAYLDPDYLDAGGKRFDLAIPGDTWTLPYVPEVALIVENKDTYRYFPPFPRAVCIYGSGYAGAANIARIGWLAEVKQLVYWGDMDADGLLILNTYRKNGIDVASILMDRTSYERYEHFGTSTATGKRSLGERTWIEAPYLLAGEADLYQLLCDPTHARHRRVEQERIPLVDAHAALFERVSGARVLPQSKKSE